MVAARTNAMAASGRTRGRTLLPEAERFQACAHRGCKVGIAQREREIGVPPEGRDHAQFGDRGSA